MIDRREPGLKARVRRFFYDNPDEELTYALLEAKFECSNKTAKWLVGELREEGMLESVHVIRLRAFGLGRVESVAELQQESEDGCCQGHPAA